MASGLEHDIAQLNSLDSALGYKDAADEAGSSRFASLFRDRGIQRHDIADRLPARVKSLGGEAEKSGSTLAAAELLLADLQQKLTGTDASIIAAVEAGQDQVNAAYRQVITGGDPVRRAVETEFAQIQANHDEMSQLKHGTT